MNKTKKNNVLNFPSAIGDAEREVEAILFAAAEPLEIESIEDNSIAQEIGFESGDSIISINGKKPRDLIDYQILISEEILNISANV